LSLINTKIQIITLNAKIYKTYGMTKYKHRTEGHKYNLTKQKLG